MIAPEPPTTDTLPAVVEGNQSTAVIGQAWTHPDGWPHAWLDFHGDRIAIRIPSRAAFEGLHYSQFAGDDAMDKAAGRFVARHVSDATFARLLDRMADPDDVEYVASQSIVMELVGLLGKIGTERWKKDTEALDAVKNGQTRNAK